MKFNNNLDKNFYTQDFSAISDLIEKIRISLVSGEKISLEDIDLSVIAKEYNPAISLVYITLFQAGQKPIRYGNRKSNLENVLNRNIEKLRENKNFANFDVKNPDNTRIMIEYVIEEKPVDINKIHTKTFDENRFEPGINGILLKNAGMVYYYMPTDAIVLNHMSLKSAFATLAKKTPISRITNKISERINILLKSQDYAAFLIKSRAFVSYKNEIVPLYRGNILYNEFDYNILIDQFVKSCDWLVDNMYEDGRFLYYYDCTDDSLIDHEHPTRREPDLYYNDLRHSGGTITLVRAFSHTQNKKYLNAAKKSLEFTVSISQKQDEKSFYTFYNKKAKLGGTGVALIAMMQYRIASNDKSFDEYIKGYVRHLLSRIYKGEFLGYYIHPLYQNGKPLEKMSDKERKETFSFYYPGEALLGLGLFANHFDDDNELVEKVRKETMPAMDWIVNERPKIYKELFTSLPSDGWLMQAIEEWANDNDFVKEDYLNFVFTDANKLVDMMYTNGDNPYLDYDGGFYYNYGDHFYPDGARSEGLIAAYYLAKKTNNIELSQKYLAASKHAAKSQFYLFNSEKSSYSHKNPIKSLNSIRFKATRQWVRVDSIQHVACFFIRLFWSENNS